MNKLLVFLSGAIFACVALVFIGRWAVSNDQVLGTSTINVQNIESQVKDKIQQSEKEGFSLISTILPKIVSAITENPLLAPFIKTQKEVSEAVSTVKNLPGDQKEALCSQICPQ